MTGSCNRNLVVVLIGHYFSFTAKRPELRAAPVSRLEVALISNKRITVHDQLRRSTLATYENQLLILPR